MNDNDNKSGLKKFFEENRTLIFTIPVFIILVIVVILVYASNGKDKAVLESPAPVESNATTTIEPSEPTPVSSPESTDTSGTEVTTLPKDEREKDESEIVRNPFAEPYKVSGIIYDEKGGSIAIIEAENKSYIVKDGDQAGEYFKVVKIESDSVTIVTEGQEIVLTLSDE